MAANYQVLSSGLYELRRAEMFARPKINGMLSSTAWIQIGDVDAITIGFTPTKVSRFRKNARVRTKAIEVVVSTDSTFNFTCFQFTPFIKMMSVLGKKVAYSQTQGPFEYPARGIGPQYVGKQDISSVTIKIGEEAFALEHYRVVDPDLGMVQVLSLPEGVTETTEYVIAGTAAAIAEGSRTKAQIGAKASETLEILIRDVGQDSNPQAYHLLEVEVAPNGDISLISEDDFASVQFSGSILDTSEGFGWTWPLKDDDAE